MIRAVVIAVGFALCAVRLTSAGVVYTYVSSGELLDLPGQTLAVPLYLEEDVSGASSPLLVNNGGLVSAGMQVVVRMATAASVTGAALDTTDFGGSSSQSPLPGSTFSFSESVAAGAPGVLPGNTGGGANPTVHSNQVYVGSVDITFPLSAPTGGVIFLEPLQPPGGHTIDKNGHDLDISSSNPAYVGASTGAIPIIVPEPASLGTAGAIGVAVLLRRSRRWRQAGW